MNKKLILGIIVLIIAGGIGGFFYFTRTADNDQGLVINDQELTNSDLPEGIDVVVEGGVSIISDVKNGIELKVSNKDTVIERNNYSSGFLLKTGDGDSAKVFVSTENNNQSFFQIIKEWIEKANEVSEVKEQIIDQGSNLKFKYVISLEDSGPLGKNYHYYLQFNNSTKIFHLIGNSLEFVENLGSNISEI